MADGGLLPPAASATARTAGPKERRARRSVPSARTTSPGGVRVSACTTSRFNSRRRREPLVPPAMRSSAVGAAVATPSRDLRRHGALPPASPAWCRPGDRVVLSGDARVAPDMLALSGAPSRSRARRCFSPETSFRARHRAPPLVAPTARTEVDSMDARRPLSTQTRRFDH